MRDVRERLVQLLGFGLQLRVEKLQVIELVLVRMRVTVRAERMSERDRELQSEAPPEREVSYGSRRTEIPSALACDSRPLGSPGMEGARKTGSRGLRALGLCVIDGRNGLLELSTGGLKVFCGLTTLLA